MIGSFWQPFHDEASSAVSTLQEIWLDDPYFRACSEAHKYKQHSYDITKYPIYL